MNRNKHNRRRLRSDLLPLKSNAGKDTERPGGRNDQRPRGYRKREMWEEREVDTRWDLATGILQPGFDFPPLGIL